ncbi:MAG: peptide chain release factor N(5)-glutamine methyltransferase [Pirellulales bacterium]|nr:peptide chain release factor N(5)-glutamine methyltransferase [Pirellulales bacterium]
MSDAPWTIGRLLNWTTEFLRERGAESPRLDAEVLLAHARGCERIMLYAAFEEPASEELRTSFRELVKQRAAGKPVAYLVGKREFFSLSFAVTPDVLIPRPETEGLVVRALDLLKARPDGAPQAIDVGTGSGAIAVCLAKHNPQVRLTAVDVSPTALAVARRNAERHGVADRIEFVESDLFAAVPASEAFELIVSNPPYVTTAELATLADDVRRYEPQIALDGGEHGTTVVERLLAAATARLAPGGWLLMEVSPAIAERIERLIDAAPGLARGDTIDDSNGLARIVQARREP